MSSEWMKFSRPTFLLTDWNLNSKQDSQCSIWSNMRPKGIPKPAKSSGNLLLWSLKEELISRIA